VDARLHLIFNFPLSTFNSFPRDSCRHAHGKAENAERKNADRFENWVSLLFLLRANLADYPIRLGKNIPLARLVCDISVLENEAGVIKEPAADHPDLDYSFMHSSDQFNSPFFLIFSCLPPFYNGFAKKDKKILKFTKKYKSLIDKE
jgi:hypothetical protein